ncbi:MAG: UDP-glucose 4-epimerase [Acidobacteriota bacterium]|jgi:nucleoside-diphosphate-sugar epimerase|nr:UDP-glucose 4-epimerase [Acidobacteriota bacterium]
MDFLKGWRGRKVLVTGATGFIGRHVVRQGLEAGVEVHRLSSRESDPSANTHRGDLNDPARVSQVFDAVEPEGVIHLAASGVAYGANEVRELVEANALGLVNLFEAALTLRTMPAFVLAGSGFEYAQRPRPLSEADPVEPFSPYGVSKACASLCARLYAERMSVTLLRLFSVYGPGEREPRLLPHLVGCARRGQPVELTGCEQVRDYTHVADAAESFWRALASAPPACTMRVLNIGTGSPVTLKQFVLHAADALRAAGHTPELLFGAKPYRPGEPMVYTAEVGLARKTLGWLPSSELEAGVRSAVACMI